MLFSGQFDLHSVSLIKAVLEFCLYIAVLFL